MKCRSKAQRVAVRREVGSTKDACPQMPDSRAVAFGLCDQGLPRSGLRDTPSQCLLQKQLNAFYRLAIPVPTSHSSLLWCFIAVRHITVCLQRGPLLIKFENKCSMEYPCLTVNEDEAEPPQVSYTSQRHSCSEGDSLCLQDARYPELRETNI